MPDELELEELDEELELDELEEDDELEDAARRLNPIHLRGTCR